MRNFNISVLARLTAAACISLGAFGLHAQEVDVAAAESLAKKNDCTKCHSVTNKKEGPPYKETAMKYKDRAKYKDVATAEAAVFKHLTTSPKVKVDGKEEEHKKTKASDDAAIMNLVRYILSR